MPTFNGWTPYAQLIHRQFQSTESLKRRSIAEEYVKHVSIR